MTLEVPGYVELATLGEDSAGTVVLARYPATGAVVAIRHLSLQLVRDRAFLERFRDEAPRLAQIRHPNLVSLHHYTEAGGDAAVVMELADGVSLGELLRTAGPLEPEVALLVLADTLRGLERLHAAGLLHRDCRPEAVVVTAEGTARLRDAGIAVQSASTLGRPGTAAYMAPEMWSDGAASAASDVYAATAMFFECLAGHPPFRAADVDELREQHERAPIPAAEAPDPLRELIQRGLDKDPARRSAGASALLAALLAAASEGYGDDWEERGRRRLAALAASLSALFPLAMFGSLLADGGAVRAEEPEPAAGGRRLGVAALAGAGLLLVLLGAGMGGLALTHRGPFAPGRGAPLAVSTLSPGALGTPSGQGSASAGATTETPSASPSPSGSPTASPKPTPSPTSRATSTATAPSPPLAVTSIALPSQLGMQGNNPWMAKPQCDPTAVADLVTNGSSGTITLTFTWTYDTQSQTGLTGPTQPKTVTATSGDTSYTVTDSITKPANAIKVLLTVTVSGGPSASGSVSTPQGCHP